MNKPEPAVEKSSPKKTVVAAVAVVLVAAGMLAIVTAAAVYHRSQPAGRGGSSSDGDPFVDHDAWRNVKVIKDFKLTERSGQTFDSTSMKGRVWVVSFFFTSCPFSCKDQNTHVQRLHKKWGPKGVTFVSITCDPETDTPKRLKEYAYGFEAHPRQWLFLTSDRLTDLQRIGGEVFQVHVDKAEHLDRLTVVDRWGKVRGHCHWKDPVQLAKLEDTLEELLAEAEPPEAEPPGDESKENRSEACDEDDETDGKQE